VTEPVARASARRTVRVAVALVAGQAVLCAVIGWVTLGSGHAHKPAPVRTVEPLAAKPLVIPPPLVAPGPKPPRSSATPSPSADRKDSTSASARSRPSTRPPRSAPARVSASARAPIKPAPPPGQPALALPSPSADDEVQSPAKPLDPCAPVDAKGLTLAGLSLLCVKSDDGSLRWQIN
jgi:hypothetical protein